MQTLPQLVAVVGFLVTGKLDAVPETIGRLHHGLLALGHMHFKMTPEVYDQGTLVQVGTSVVLEVRSK
jgi:hypothetical protein